MIRSRIRACTIALALVAPTAFAAPQESVTITYGTGPDARGVPFIVGTTDFAAYFGVGYAQARMRYLQMCIGRLAGQGRLSEVFGEDASVRPVSGVPAQQPPGAGRFLEWDKFARTRGFRIMADRAAAKLAQPGYEHYEDMLQSFANGVNAFRDDVGLNYCSSTAPGDDCLDPLFQEYRIPREDWTVADCVLLWIVNTRPFSQGWTADITNAGLVHAATSVSEYPARVFGDAPFVDRTVTVAQTEHDSAALTAATGYTLVNDVNHVRKANPGIFDPHFSNALAVSGTVVEGEHGSDALAYLWQAPRIGVTSPSPLFEWYVSCPEFEVRGAGFPGSPNLLVGGTAGVEDPTYVPVAWSMCGAASDLGDCFELALNQDGTQYRFGSGFDPIVSRPEPIIVKNPPGTTPPMRTEPFTVQETFWGPIIPELESRTAYVSGRRRAEGLTGPEAQAIIDDPNEVIPRYAFTDATGLIGPTSRASAPEIPFLAHDRMYRSSGIDEFLTAVREDYSYPAANMTIAAGDGQIGFTITGAIPVRRPAPEVVNPNQAQLRRKWAGRLPMKARWVGNRWQEFMPPELRPFGKNPAKGYFHNGNQSGVFFDHPLACYYASPSGDGERSCFLRRYVDRKIAEGAGTMQRADLEALSQSRQREVGPLVAKLIMLIGAEQALFGRHPNASFSQEALDFATTVQSDGVTADTQLDGLNEGQAMAYLAKAYDGRQPSSIDAAVEKWGAREFGALNMLEELERALDDPTIVIDVTAAESKLMDFIAKDAYDDFAAQDGNAGVTPGDLSAFNARERSPGLLPGDSITFPSSSAALSRNASFHLSGLGPPPVYGAPVDPLEVVVFAGEPLFVPIGYTMSETKGAAFNGFVALNGTNKTDRMSMTAVGQSEKEVSPHFSDQLDDLQLGLCQPAPCQPATSGTSIVRSVPNP